MNIYELKKAIKNCIGWQAACNYCPVFGSGTCVDTLLQESRKYIRGDKLNDAINACLGKGGCGKCVFSSIDQVYYYTCIDALFDEILVQLEED